MPGVELIRALLEQGTAKGTRSTVLKPLGWLMAILVSAILTAFYTGAPEWVGITFFVFAILTISLYLVAYAYCLLNDPDALRSETYSIQKLAIEHGFVGDDLSGLIAPKDQGVGLIGMASEEDSGGVE